MELPLPSEVETGTNSPITPASSRTAPTAMINRRSVTIRPFVRGLRLGEQIALCIQRRIADERRELLETFRDWDGA